MKIPLSVPNLEGREWKYVKECLDSSWVSSAGYFVGTFETAVSRFIKNKYAVACVNGTAGLHTALKISGVCPGDEVIVPTLTFIAPVNAVRYVMAEPVFMDCDDYMNIDCRKLREFCARECTVTRNGLQNRRTKRMVRAVVPVHVFGNPCDMAEILRIAAQYRLKIIEDATESIGAYYTAGPHRNKFTGTIGDIGVYSFNGNKIITSGGGGMIVTDNKAAAETALYLINQAKDDPLQSIHHEIGFNYRLTGLQAALGLAQFEKLESFIKIKKRNYELYRRLLAGIDGLTLIGVPEGTAPNYWFYSLAVDRKRFGKSRDEVMEHLESKGIQTRPVWYLNHLQRPYRRNLAYKIENAPRFRRGVLNLPCSTNLKAEEIKYIVSIIRDARKGVSYA
ncbi:MAG: LegC family aminotransferase [Candidatus Omnitrophica bacterium]|nr:LegC family aminotransferase [Candidatus Omnitrophota bacterium]